MKTKSALIIASVIASLTQLAHAQCPELCDSNQNTAVGESALSNNTGPGNTAVGFEALMSNTAGSFNTAYGLQTLSSSQFGGNNTAIGAFALTLCTAFDNTAIGYQSLSSNTTGGGNTAMGRGALMSNTWAGENTAVGLNALSFNTGWYNSALGSWALYQNTTAEYNSSVGYRALYFNTTGWNNTAIGSSALVGNTTGDYNIAVGDHAGANITAGIYNIDIGNKGVPGESNTIRIGANIHQASAYIAGINGVTIPGGVGVLIDGQGHLGTNTSSARYKEQIKPMDKSSEAILSLQPVTFRYKHRLDPDGVPQFGLVAEDVEKVDRDLVARDDQGKPYSVRYEAVNAMLLNEFLKEHRKVEEQEKRVDALTAQLKEQASKIQQISAELQLGKSSPQTVLNNQ